ncbi:MerR family transcriptional regulator [Thermaurantiacus sp.]
MAEDGEPGPAAPARMKAPAALRTISEVSDEIAVPQHILRFWETRFPELKPMKRGGNRRYYRPDDVALCKALKRLLHEEGYTVKGVRKLIAQGGVRSLMAGMPPPPPRLPGDVPPPAEAPARAEPLLQGRTMLPPQGAGQLRAIRDRLALALDRARRPAGLIAAS